MRHALYLTHPRPSPRSPTYSIDLPRSPALLCPRSSTRPHAPHALTRPHATSNRYWTSLYLTYPRAGTGELTLVPEFNNLLKSFEAMVNLGLASKHFDIDFWTAEAEDLAVPEFLSLMYAHAHTRPAASRPWPRVWRLPTARGSHIRSLFPLNAPPTLAPSGSSLSSTTTACSSWSCSSSECSWRCSPPHSSPSARRPSSSSANDSRGASRARSNLGLETSASRVAAARAS